MNAVIIVAGGQGRRMGGDVPKQFLPVDGRPVLMRTIDRFRQWDPTAQIVLVLPADQQLYWAGLCVVYGESFSTVGLTLADGGETRFHSVRNGLQLVRPEATLIGVHDGVRPFVSVEVVEACFAGASRHGACIPVVDVVETLRHMTPEGSHTVPRADYRLVQTPQVFSAEWLREAYAQPYTPDFTDDASVVEAAGHRVALVPGNRENIKLTTPFDMALAECLAR